MDTSDTHILQRDLNSLEEWTVETEMNISRSKCKAVSFTKVRVKERIRYYFVYKLIA